MKNKQSNFYRSLIATALLTNGIFQFVAPVIAEGTKAGQTIDNTATATYEDPQDPGTKINATSNTVTVTVAEVAGITVTAAGVTDSTPGTKVQVDDTVTYTYRVTNVGNDITKFRIPEAVKVTGPGVAGKPEYSLDGGATWIAISGSEYISNAIPVDGFILVRVPVIVQAGAQPNDIIGVTLGNTPGDAQNQLRIPDGGDVYTIDADPTNPPVNGVREASATQKATVEQSANTYALATVLKTRTGHDKAGTPAINDDKLTYSLSLRVELNDPTGNGIIPAALTGTKVNGLTGDRILVSDAIPTDTELAAIPAPPSGWQVVYTTDSVGTNANAANWTLTVPSNLSTVTRVGFVNNPTVVQSVAPGQNVSGFDIQLKVKSTVTAPTLTVNNIAQLFGQTLGIPSVDTDTNGIPDNQIYDESGDQKPSNYNDDNTPPGADADKNGIPDDNSIVVTNGLVIDATSAGTGTDSGNNNTGTGPGGEANSYLVTALQGNAVLNGPKDAPDAIGSTGIDDDFTNKSSLVPIGMKPLDPNGLDPAPVSFTNTLKNSDTTQRNISLIPTPPTTLADLPVNTVVTISYGSESRTYLWKGNNFEFDADGNPATPSSPIGTNYITIPNVAAGGSVNYGVEVNLPSGTKLSTDIDKGFPVPITAFIDDGTAGFDGTEPKNITIDRVYTGFLKMEKESRVLPGTGPAVPSSDATFSSAAKKPAPGNIIEYRIKYKNISEAQSGTGNVILKADKVVIVEDGTLSTATADGKNNWAKDNDANGKIDTSNIVGSAKDTGTSTIQFFKGATGSNLGADQTGTTADTDVSKYINSVTGSVEPQVSREFTFQRKVN